MPEIGNKPLDFNKAISKHCGIIWFSIDIFRFVTLKNELLW